MTSLTEGELLRMDKRGRARVSAERRAELLAEYDRSGQSGAVFARWAGINYQTLSGWLHRRRRGKQQPERSGGPTFAEVTVVSAGESTPSGRGQELGRLRVELPGGAWLELDGAPGALRVAAELLGELAARTRRTGTC